MFLDQLLDSRSGATSALPSTDTLDVAFCARHIPGCSSSRVTGIVGVP